MTRTLVTCIAALIVLGHMSGVSRADTEPEVETVEAKIVEGTFGTLTWGGGRPVTIVIPTNVSSGDEKPEVQLGVWFGSAEEDGTIPVGKKSFWPEGGKWTIRIGILDFQSKRIAGVVRYKEYDGTRHLVIFKKTP